MEIDFTTNSHTFEKITREMIDQAFDEPNSSVRLIKLHDTHFYPLARIIHLRDTLHLCFTMNQNNQYGLTLPVDLDRDLIVRLMNLNL